MKRTIGPLEIRTGGPLAKGEKVSGHAHAKDHVTYCATGAMEVRRLSDAGRVISMETVRAGTLLDSHILIEAGICHELEALEDNTTYHCIFAHYDMSDRPSQTYDGHEAVYR